MVKNVFVFGIARSGTNLIAGMLNAHPKVVLALDPLMPFFKALRNSLLMCESDFFLGDNFAPESPFQDGYFGATGFRHLDVIMAGSLNLALGQECEGLVAAIGDRAALEEPELARRLRSVKGDTYSDILAQILEVVTPDKADSLQWCGCKEVWTTEFIPLLARAYPDAKFVVIRRDPRGVLASLIAMAEKDPTQAAHTVSYMRHWRKEGAVVSNLLEDCDLRDRIVVLSYETLVSNPENCVHRLCAFLDLEKDQAMFSPVPGRSGLGTGNSSYGAVAGVSGESTERWRDGLSSDIVQTIEYHCGPEMQLEGYVPISDFPISLDDATARVVMEAHVNSGSWRSDAGVPNDDLAHEENRWRLLSSSKASQSNEEIRRHFLFESYFNLLRTAVYPALQATIN